MSRIFRDQQGNKVQPGEVWYDHAGNECSYREWNVESYNDQ